MHEPVPEAVPPTPRAVRRGVAAVVIGLLTAVAVNLAAVSPACRGELLQALVRSVS